MVLSIKKVGEVKVDSYLPNSISKYKDGFTLSDGGNNRVKIFDKELNELYSIGEFGLGEYRFKEPVFSYIDGEELYVCDWHNHRIVRYESGKFKEQIGIPGLSERNRLVNLVSIFKNLKNNGLYYKQHFNGVKNTPPKVSFKLAIKNTCNGVLYYTSKIKFLISALRDKTFICKPNGLCKVGEDIVFTQKDNNCVSKYSLGAKKIIRQVSCYPEGDKFGRLGQVYLYNNIVYVCDEERNKLVLFSENLEFTNVINLGFKVFSICRNDDFIVLCGEKKILVLDKGYCPIIKEDFEDSEFHGVEILDNNSFLVVNRFKSLIEKYEIYYE